MEHLFPSYTKDPSKNDTPPQNSFFSSLISYPDKITSSNNIIISPKKGEKIVREKNLNNPLFEIELKDLCKKLDFSEASENTMSNCSISDNENMEINEASSEDLPEMKTNNDFLWFSSNSLTKIKPKKKIKNFSEKNTTFISKKQNSEDSLDNYISKFEEEYIILHTLCRGEMGTVYLCLRLKDKKKFAVKKTKFFLGKFDFDNMNIFVKDVEKHLDEIGNEFILKYKDFWLEEKLFLEKKNYKNNSNMKETYIVTDYCKNGNLKEFLTNLKKNYKNKMTYDFYWDIIFQMIVPINYLHSIGYIHSDIKPTNYLINDNNQLLLNDFCLSIKEREIKTKELEGDSIYISPELFYKNSGKISHKTDIYSLGLSILDILIDEDLPKNGPIWQEMRNREIPKDLINKIIIINNNFEEMEKLIELIKDLTKINSNERPELNDLLNDENKYPELYKRYQDLKNGKYIKNIIINNINVSDNIFLGKKDNDNNSDLNSDIYNDNINKIFFKRSNSMENLA